MIDLDNLEALAKAAAEHDADADWYYGVTTKQVEVGYWRNRAAHGGMCWAPVDVADEDPAAVEAQGRFIAAASPSTVIKLITEQRALKAALGEACDIAGTAIKLQGDFHGRHNKLGSERVAELRKLVRDDP